MATRGTGRHLCGLQAGRQPGVKRRRVAASSRRAANARDRSWRASQQKLAADLTQPLRTIDLDPPLLHRALRYYHRHPEARAELATPAGLARVRHGRFPPAEPAAEGRRADRAEGRG